MPSNVPAPAEQMIAALIPAPLPRASPPRPPLPRLPAPRTGPDLADAQLDVGRLDPSGRISARPLLHRLGWPPGHRIQFDIAHDAITATSSPTARHTVGATGLLAIPSAIRQLCHLTAGDVVVLLANPGRDLLLIHPARTVAQFLAERFATDDDA
ncbi:AbrB/MazE/SpoVT family DNA-binding domain-containing protein [Dactylosporangium siamense]|uniref:AbrB/MazE/SpoVT family DNA-binding domain-containing protein n=1 Tax=Dactylosporangium siamense TaxID=685454 RepID=UPI0019458A5A|nr:AbrB/MazE/SpoVT family DNA-binding domain-containing protein [Dactylosporangium siamense]